MQPFMTSSASGARVSILNPLDEPPREELSASPPTSITTKSSDAGSTSRQPRLYPCSECDKVFTTSGHRSRHAKLHSGEKPFHCPFPACSMSCTRQDNLVQHFRKHLPKADRKRDGAYVRQAIARMRLSSAAEIRDGPSPSMSPSLIDQDPPDFSVSLVVPESPTYSFRMATTTSTTPPSLALADNARVATDDHHFPVPQSGSMSPSSEEEPERRAGDFQISFMRGNQKRKEDVTDPDAWGSRRTGNGGT